MARRAARSPALIALVRAVNVAGKNRLRMSDLKALVEGVGGRDVRTLLQSGNVVCRSTTAPARLEAQLARAAAKDLGLETSFYVRTEKQWQALHDANPFPLEAEERPGRLLAMVLADAPEHTAIRALDEVIPGEERVEVIGRTAYLVFPGGVGRSKLTTRLLERTLGTTGTARNWNTVRRILAALSQRSATS